MYIPDNEITITSPRRNGKNSTQDHLIDTFASKIVGGRCDNPHVARDKKTYKKTYNKNFKRKKRLN